MGREKHAEQAYREKAQENGKSVCATEVSAGVVSIFTSILIFPQTSFWL